MFDEKAQLHTLEGVAAATLILFVIIYAIDATSLTPLTSSTANVHVESELMVLGQDILSALDYAEPGYSSELKNAIIIWNGSEYVWNGTAYVDKRNTANSLTNNLTKILRNTLVEQGIAHNVELIFLDNITLLPGSPVKMIHNGDPSNNAVVVSRKFALHDGDLKSPLNQTIEDIDPATNFYNIVDVRLVLWRM